MPALFRKQPHDPRMRAPDFRRRLTALVASARVGAIGQEPSHGFRIAPPREVQKQRALKVTAVRSRKWR
jgi:hypothetical protein